MVRNVHKGFTAIDLMVAIAVGVMLLGAAYQLYSVVLSESGEAQKRALADNSAYDLLRQYQARTTVPCTTLSETPSLPAGTTLQGATVTAVITCPYHQYDGGGLLLYASDVSLVTVTVNYNNPDARKVIRAIAVKP